ncbi:MAG: hypothetical protein JWP63_4606 [Candidatus Solibacter sp.]|jgi:hypothetical protein|nr:hypothetical protein [Candidatus Solibacter sp.]
MTILRSVVLLTVAAAGLVYAADAPLKVAGTWTMALDTPHGKMPGSLVLKQDGSKLTGSVDVEHMGSMALTGEMAGEKISFSIEIQAGQKITFAGSVAGDKMSGSMEQGGSWSATRAEAHI